MIHYIVEHNNYKSLFKSLELKLSNEKYDYDSLSKNVGK